MFRTRHVSLATFLLAFFIGTLTGVEDVHAQSSATASMSVAVAVNQSAPSPGKAFGLSLLLPGLGHRYVNGGQWTAWSGTLATGDAALWIGLFAGSWHRNHLIDSYQTLAASSAGADLDGKTRTFYLNMASYKSSDEFLDSVLRNRAWDQVGYVEDPSFHWSWSSDEDYLRYRDMRDESESLGRRRSILIASIVANRLINGLVAARKASGMRASPTAPSQFSAGFAPPVGGRPVLSLGLRF